MQPLEKIHENENENENNNLNGLEGMYGSEGSMTERLRKEKEKHSKWDPYIDEAKEILSKPHVSYKAVYMYLFNKYGEDKLPGDYHSLRNYLWANGIKRKNDNTPHLLYETPPGKQSQFDWKEDMKIHLVDGTEIIFNVFSLTLSYSREHIFIYSSHKTTDDLLHCLIKAINKLGGVSKEYLTDNMSAIVSLKGSGKSVYPKVSQFFKDIGSKLILSKARTPEKIVMMKQILLN